MGGVTLITRDELGALFRRAHRDDAARLDAPVGGGEAAEQVARLLRARALLPAQARGGRRQARDVERLDDPARLPFTTKQELRQSQAERAPYGDFVCADPIEILRVHLSSARPESRS